MPPAHREDASATGTPAAMAEDRVSRNVSFAFLAQMVGAVLTAALTIFLGRALAPSQFGYFTFALSVIMIATLFADLGITPSSSRFLAERRDQPLAVAAVFRTTLRLKFQIGIPVSLALLAFAGPLCDAFGTPGATGALRACSAALLAQSVFSLFLGVFIALGRLRYNVTLAMIESVSEAIATVALVVLGAAATGAALGRAVGYTVGMVAGLALVRRTIGDLRAGKDSQDTSVVSPRRIISYAGPLLVVDAAFRVFASIDVLLIAALVGGGAQIAAFGLPMRFAAFLDFPAAAVAAAVAPRMARQRDHALVLLSRSMRYLIIIQVLCAAPLLIWPEAIIHLVLGDKYPDAPEVLRVLSPYVLLAGVAQPTTLAVNYLGQANRRVPLALAMLTLNVVIDIILLPRIGIVAAAIGTSAAYALWVPAHVWILRQHAGLRLRPLILTTARTCIAGAAMIGVLALLGTGRVAVPLMLAGAVLGPLVYIAALFALHELSGEDIAVLRGILSRRVSA
jgi:O-antigen/teichoic acid export membrane protein